MSVRSNQLFTVLLTVLRGVVAVDISAVSYRLLPGTDTYANLVMSCRNIPPGVCCNLSAGVPEHYLADKITISDLVDRDVSFAHIYEVRDDPASFESQYGYHLDWTEIHDGCDGRPSTTLEGPLPYWEAEFSWDRPYYFLGASWISLRFAPPATKGESNWLGVQGVRGLEWNGGQWLAGADSLSQYRMNPGKRVLMKRVSRPIDKGTAYFASPPAKRFPDLILVNGTNYTDDMRGDLVYKSPTGIVLDLSKTKN